MPVVLKLRCLRSFSFLFCWAVLFFLYGLGLTMAMLLPSQHFTTYCHLQEEMLHLMTGLDHKT